MVEILKLALIITVIIVMIRLKVPLSITLTVSALILGILFRLPLTKLGFGVVDTFLNLENLKLVLALQLVLLFSAVLKENGAMQRAISALSGVVRDARFCVAVIPAIVGLLPVVGGAMLSAPLVDEASDELRLTAERRTFLNFWFRHVWEYTLPTFPAVFLTASIAGVPVAELAAAGIPLTLMAIAAGAVFGFKGVAGTPSRRPVGSAPSRWTHMWSFILNLLPFFLVILLTVALDVHLLYPMVLVTTGMVLFGRMPIGRLRQLARQHLSIELAFLIWGIMLFKEILLSTEAMDGMARDLAGMGIPTAVLVVVLPALIAFITGYTTAFIGLSFPVLVPFIPAGDMTVFYVMLALASGICAHLLSPMHACLTMTMQYYRAEIGRTYGLLLLPTLLLFLTGSSVFAAALWLMN
jgi:integral membrane protein (TIGR00529 family)